MVDSGESAERMERRGFSAVELSRNKWASAKAVNGGAHVIILKRIA